MDSDRNNVMSYSLFFAFLQVVDRDMVLGLEIQVGRPTCTLAQLDFGNQAQYLGGSHIGWNNTQILIIYSIC